MSLEELRQRIDDIDGQLVTLLNERARVVMEIGKVGGPAHFPSGTCGDQPPDVQKAQARLESAPAKSATASRMAREISSQE